MLNIFINKSLLFGSMIITSMVKPSMFGREKPIWSLGLVRHKSHIPLHTIRSTVSSYKVLRSILDCMVKAGIVWQTYATSTLVGAFNLVVVCQITSNPTCLYINPQFLGRNLHFHTFSGQKSAISCGEPWVCLEIGHPAARSQLSVKSCCCLAASSERNVERPSMIPGGL